ncbi:SPFH domain-containing protein [Aquitalea sp. LB_tupeE]|uniref:SPFH domain-containing protein n=1 Tax=Aquitalea sp. LB_tupeE TaxID=2748078 RepID=UPI0015BBFD4A|nr:SPFH domain-containing protein [Aquitalea sp. LB_tupeE]NWK79009.1 protease modulator HflK [Aquitalea sp. LB_tupeE]
MKTSPSTLADAATRQELLYRRCALPTLLLAITCLLAGLLLSGGTARLLCLSLSASLWLLSGTLYSSSHLAGWRRKRQALPALPLLPRLLPGKPSPANNTARTHGSAGKYSLRRWLLWPRLRRLIGRSTGWAVVQQTSASLLALPLSLLVMQATPESPLNPDGLLAALLCGLVLSFATLLLERSLALQDAAQWPEALKLQAILRAVLLSMLLPSLAAAGLLLGLDWLLRLLQAGALLTALLALELGLRALWQIFQPYQRHQPAALPFNSLLASLLGRDGVRNWRSRLQQGLGLELRQSWALQYLGRAMRPFALALLVGGWLLSSISTINTDQRGIYERFGQPVAVWQAGWHLGLPWPFGKVRRVEYGVVHQLASGLQQDSQGRWQSPDNTSTTSNNHLWDGNHTAETTQLIASQQGERQSTQLVGLDVRLVYREGLRDADALALYQQADPTALLHAVADRAMLHYFAGQQLDNLLGDALADTSRQLQQQIQQALNRSGSGLELLAVVIQAIHPPAAAANAYHGVQAAAILAQARVATERGLAVRSHSAAVQAAVQAAREASASAAERVAHSKVDAIAFQADRQAASVGGQSFLLERYLHALGQGLHQAQPIIIDHRIPASALPTIDLRPAANNPGLPAIDLHGAPIATEPPPAIAGTHP